MSGWVEFAITRANYYVIATGVNGGGQREFVIQSPLFPFPDVRSGTPKLTPALYVGDYAWGIQFIDACF